MTNLQDKYYYFHFIDEEVEAQRGQVICLFKVHIAVEHGIQTLDLYHGILAPPFMLFTLYYLLGWAQNVCETVK